MANQEKSSDAKSLEMRIAALEDKLAKLNVSEEEMRAYEKVSSMLGGGAAGSGTGGAEYTPNPDPFVCQISRVPRYISRLPRIRFCYECGPCTLCDPSGGGGPFGGGGFGGFGM